MAIRVLVVDDHEIVRHGLASLFEGSDVQIVAECPDGATAVAVIRRERPDVVFLDVQMPEVGGFEVMRQLDDDEMPAAFESHDPRLAERTRRFAGSQRRADQTTDAAVRALHGVTSPAFLWIHYVDAHLTYDPPPPWDRRRTP